MSQINELFKMHNIKYICSVDDCYAGPDIGEIRAKVYAGILENQALFQTVLTNSDYSSMYTEIIAMSSVGMPIDDMSRKLIETLSEKTLLDCYTILDENFETTNKQKEAMQKFLDSLKEDNVILDYQLIPRTGDAAKLKLPEYTDGAILWLVDRDFSRVNESENAGLEFAKTLVERDQSLNYIYIVSAINADGDKTEGEVEEEFDQILNTSCDLSDKESFCYFIHKSKIQTFNKDKIAKSLAQGFRRKANFIIIDEIHKYMHGSLDKARDLYKKIDQKTLNFAISGQVIEKGESCFEFVVRMMKLMYEKEFKECISEHFESIATRISKYEEIYDNDIKVNADAKTAAQTLKSIREMELYDAHINAQHKEIAFGDIFDIENEKFILISQPCDCTLRKNGKRNLTSGILLKIVDGKEGLGAYQLPCFKDFAKPAVNFHSYTSIPFELLDLCALNSDGQAILSRNFLNREVLLPNFFSSNFKKRFADILDLLKPILDKISNSNAFTEESEMSSVIDTYRELLNENRYYWNCNIEPEQFVYPIQRICRISEINAISIAQSFTSVFSRVGLPFEYLSC